MHNLTLSLSLALMCGITAYAQDVTETVVVETPGTLIDLVANLSSPRINTLVVKGQLDANDLSYLGAPSGKLRTVKELELRDITLVESDTPTRGSPTTTAAVCSVPHPSHSISPPIRDGSPRWSIRHSADRIT